MWMKPEHASAGLQFQRFLKWIFATVVMLCLQVMPLRAEVSFMDCAAFGHMLAFDGQGSELDLDARDAMARRIERHGESLGLSLTQTQLSALALRDNDMELAKLILTDRDPLQQAYGNCLASLALTYPDIEPTAQGKVQNTMRQDSTRFPIIRVWSVQMSGSWMMFAAVSGGIFLIGGVFWWMGLAGHANRRRSRRFNCDIPAVLRHCDGSELPVRVTDISLDGCRLSLEEAGVTVGVQAMLLLGPTTVAASVVWCNKHFCEVNFSKRLPERDLSHFLQQDRGPGLVLAPG
jgi:hypothetical protein